MRAQRVPVIPEVDSSGYLEELENLVRESNFRWYLEYLEDRMIQMGYTEIYDVMAAYFLYTRGWRLRFPWNRPTVLNTTGVSQGDWNSIRRTYAQLFAAERYRNKNKRARY